MQNLPDMLYMFLRVTVKDDYIVNYLTKIIEAGKCLVHSSIVVLTD